MAGREGVRHPNRIKAREPRRIRVWCVCDRALVSPDRRCPVCQRRLRDRPRLKKAPFTPSA